MNESQEPQAPEGAVSGEVLPAEAPYLWDGDDRRRDRQHRRYPQEIVEEAIRARALGFTLKEIGQRLGCSHEIVRRWCNEHQKSREYVAADIPKVRASMAVELETAEFEAMRVVRMYPGTELALKALGVFKGLITTRANLIGAVAPARTEADAGRVSATDLELIDMINSAKAKADAEIAKIQNAFEGGR